MVAAESRLIGQRFGRLTVVAFAGRYVSGGRAKSLRWECRCDCGTKTTVFAGGLTSGQTQSCGCLRLERTITHGKTRTPEYRVWTSLRDRCSNPRSRSYARYGGRGIAVCERWASFEAFFADMGPRPSARHSIDRIDNDGPYAPANCRWALPKVQMRNRRACRFLSFRGESRPASEWAEMQGLNYNAVMLRLQKGWPVERALTVPIRPKRPNGSGEASGRVRCHA